LGLAIMTGIILTIASATMSWANVSGHSHLKRPDASRFIWHVLKSKDTLNLSEDQQARLQSIALNFRRDNVKKTAEVKLAEIELHQLAQIDGKPSSGEGVAAAVRKMYELKADQQLASIKAFQEARAVLTPEQQQKLRELREQRHAAEQRHATAAEPHADTR
jgi:Spy/CpxP family protein refolding chaperone